MPPDLPEEPVEPIDPQPPATPSEPVDPDEPDLPEPEEPDLPEPEDPAEPGDTTGEPQPPGPADQAVALDLENMTTYTSGLGTLGVTSDYNIRLNFTDDRLPVEVKAGVIRIAEHFSSLITGDLSDVSARDPRLAERHWNVDDTSIDVRIIPNSGTTLGVGGTVAYRGKEESDGLPFVGHLNLTERVALGDLDVERFETVTIHEMAHALGFGTIWERKDLIAKPTGDGHARFLGENARLAYEAMYPDLHGNDPGADAGVPSSGGHWSEIFDGTASGVMHGIYNPALGVSGLDPMSLASLEDLGYDTIWDASSPAAPLPDQAAIPYVVQGSPDASVAAYAEAVTAADLDTEDPLMDLAALIENEAHSNGSVEQLLNDLAAFSDNESQSSEPIMLADSLTDSFCTMIDFLPPDLGRVEEVYG